MDTKRILAELGVERQRIDQAIAALELLDHAGTASSPGLKLPVPAWS